MSEPGAAASEVDLLFELVRERYGGRLSPDELDAVRTALAGIVDGARALRAVRLDNADGPLLPLLPEASSAP
jgi:hypothetical protein